MITRLPEVTREGTARLWVSYSQDYPSGGTPTTPRCLTRASGPTSTSIASLVRKNDLSRTWTNALGLRTKPSRRRSRRRDHAAILGVEAVEHNTSAEKASL
ncbi:hypothetical protein LSAT2_017826 [Lamellibrachia satsuma]|nr:hypothetical protein LSAT2_017826 [Lamellibrachia satsuma]